MSDIFINGLWDVDIFKRLKDASLRINANMANDKRADYRLLSYFIILLVFGLVMLTSASLPVGHEKFADGYFFIKRQLFLGVLPGLVLFFIFSKINFQQLKKYSFPFFILANILLLLVLVPGLGSTSGTNAHSWFNFLGFSFQPSELAKLALVIYLAAYLSARGKELLDFKNGFLVALGLGMIPVVLILAEPDVGTMIILFVILFGILFVAGCKLTHIIGLAVVGLSCFVILIWVAPYRTARLTTFMHPELDPQGIGYQMNQAFLAVGSGGIFGRGLGHSLQKFQYLPEVDSDTIFAIIAEEMGFIFSLGLIILWVLIICRGLVLAKNTPDKFGRLLVSGILIWFGVQSFLNIGAMVGALPLTGVPLPFVSHGGSALMIAMGAVGVLVNVSKQTS